jgi:hypothetical protein
MKEIREYTMKEFSEFSNGELFGINDIQLLILKGHILVEYTLNCYLESISKSRESDFFKENFSFADKVNIAKHFGQIGDDKDNLNKELILLNKLRNEIAHNLAYNDKLLQEIFFELNKKIPNEIYTDKKVPLKIKINAAIAFISGAIFAAYKLSTDNEDVDNFIKENEK